MSGFVVDSRTLVAVRDTLDRLHDQLVGMHTVIWHQWGTLGGHALESELEHFCGSWHYGVSELGGQLSDLTRRLGEAAAAYERIEERITHAGGGSGSGSGGAAGGPAGSGHRNGGVAHHSTKHASSGHHAAKHAEPRHHSAQGTHYSGGAPIAPSGAGSHSGDQHPKGDKHPGNADKHSGDGDKRSGDGDKHPGEGSGTTVIGGAPEHGGGAKHHPRGGSGSGTTLIGGGPTHSSSGGSGRGSGTTTIDEKIRRSEQRQRAELASVRHMVKD